MDVVVIDILQQIYDVAVVGHSAGLLAGLVLLGDFHSPAENTRPQNRRYQDYDNYVWCRDAKKNKLVVGTQCRILYQDALVVELADHLIVVLERFVNQLGEALGVLVQHVGALLERRSWRHVWRPGQGR